MLKIIMLLYFLQAAVTGQMQLQNNGQIQRPTPVEQALYFKDYPPLIARRKPCQKRKNFQIPDEKPPTTNWVPTFQTVNVPPIINQKIVRDINNKQLEPQSLKESKAIPLQEQSSITENAVQNPFMKLEEPFLDQTASMIREEVVFDSHNLRVSNNQDPIDEYLCSTLDDTIERSEQAKLEKSKQNKKPSDEVNKQAIKLISKCAQDAQSTTRDETRRSWSGNSDALLDKPSYRPLNIPINDDSDDPRLHDNLEKNNDFDPSQPLVLRSVPAVAAESQSPFGQEGRRAQFEIMRELQHPVMNNFIRNISDSKVSLLKNTRVCYACSSANDLTCWQPNKTTTVKYCKKNDDACVIKTIKTYDALIMVRDCGNTCNEDIYPGVMPRYKSCQICHADMCNGAAFIHSFNMLLITFLMAAFKYAL